LRQHIAGAEAAFPRYESMKQSSPFFVFCSKISLLRHYLFAPSLALRSAAQTGRLRRNIDKKLSISTPLAPNIIS
jgi:hypothetical protein